MDENKNDDSVACKDVLKCSKKSNKKISTGKNRIMHPLTLESVAEVPSKTDLKSNWSLFFPLFRWCGGQAHDRLVGTERGQRQHHSPHPPLHLHPNSQIDEKWTSRGKKRKEGEVLLTPHSPQRGQAPSRKKSFLSFRSIGSEREGKGTLCWKRWNVYCWGTPLH